MADKTLTVKIGSKENGYVTCTLYWNATGSAKAVKTTLVKMVVKNEREYNDNEKSYQVNYSVTLGGQSFYSHGGSWTNGSTKTVKIAQSKVTNKTERDQKVELRITATHGTSVQMGRYIGTVPAFSDALLTPSAGMTPTGLSIKRDGNKFTGSWKVPSGATSSSAINKFTGQVAKWTVVCTPVEKVAEYQDKGYSPKQSWKLAKEKLQDLDKGLAANATSVTQSYGEFKSEWQTGKMDRSDFYPLSYVIVSGLALKVRGYHKRSNNDKYLLGNWSGTSVYKFKKPRKPTVTISVDAATKKATVTIKSDEGKDAHERYWTRYYVELTRLDGKPVCIKSGETKKTEASATFDLTGYLNGVSAGKHVTLRCTATAEGMAGYTKDSASVNVGMPGIPQIHKVELKGKKVNTSIVAVTCSHTGGVSTTIQLQRKVGEDGTWTDVQGATDNGKNLKTLFDTYGAVWPNGVVKGEMVYYKLVATAFNYRQESAEFKAECLYEEKPVPKCTSELSLTPSVKVGSSYATVYVHTEDTKPKTDKSWGLTGEAADHYTGTVLHYADKKGELNRPGGWEEMKVEYTDKEKTAQFDITGLEPGKTYYFRARRYWTVEGKDYYSEKVESSFTTVSARSVKSKITLVEKTRVGTSVDITVKFNGPVATNGTAISFSTNPGAWTGGTDPTEYVYYYADEGESHKKGNHKVTLANLDPGIRYYIHARRVRKVSEGGSEVITYGEYSEQQEYKATNSVDAPCDIMAHNPEVTGRGAMVVVGHNDDQLDGTVIEWSTDEHAWKSTKAPSSYEMSWVDDETPYNAGQWPKSQTVYLRDLEIGKNYWLRARRYDDSTGQRLYGEPCKPQTFDTIAGTAWDDECAIDSVIPDDAGTGAKVVVAWNENNANTGTELSWSTDPDAWTSNEGPTTMQATWKDDTGKVAGYGGSQTIMLRGLEPGNTYYIRARRYEDQANTFSPYSNKPSFVTPSSGDVRKVMCGIVSVEGVGADAARAVVGWTGEADGCEVSWSDDPNAWQSTEGPQRSEFDWADPVNGSAHLTTDLTVDPSNVYFTRSGSGTAADPYVYTRVASPVTSGLPTYYEFDWGSTGTLYINGLEQGTTYYVKARAYTDGDGGRVWSDYSATYDVTPITVPSSVALSAPTTIGRGEPIELFWSVEHELEQTEWHVHVEGSTGGFKTADTAIVSGKAYYTRTGDGSIDHPYEYTRVANPTAAGLPTYYELISGGVELESGTGSLCHATIGPERYAAVTSLSVFVRAGCGGGTTDSNVVTIGIADAPSCEVSCAKTATGTPITAWAYTDDPAALLSATCRSLGVTSEQPGGQVVQLTGDTVWTSLMGPAWSLTTWGQTQLRDQLEDAVTEAEDAYEEAIDEATFALTEDDEVMAGKTYYALSGGAYAPVTPQAGDDPSAQGWYEIPDEIEAMTVDNARIAIADSQAALDAHPSNGSVYKASFDIPIDGSLIDNGTYALSAKASEQSAGLASEEAACAFDVAWEHQAPVPEDVEVTVDEAGRTASVYLPEPDGWAEGDSFEVYRMSPTGHELIAENVAAGSTVVDAYAPFGDAHYRVACRTAEHDVAFEDFAYSLPVKALRFDWPGGFVELPYNIELSDSYEKSFEARSHVDGSVNGYYDKAVKRTGSYKVDVSKADSKTIAKLRELGTHPGAMFCRRADGEAFQCNADLGGVDLSYATMAAGVTFPVTGMKLTRQYMAEVQEG